MGQRLPSTIQLDTTAREIDLDTDRPYRVHRHVAGIFPSRDMMTTTATASVPTDSMP